MYVDIQRWLAELERKKPVRTFHQKGEEYNEDDVSPKFIFALAYTSIYVGTWSTKTRAFRKDSPIVQIHSRSFRTLNEKFAEVSGAALYILFISLSAMCVYMCVSTALD